MFKNCFSCIEKPPKKVNPNNIKKKVSFSQNLPTKITCTSDLEAKLPSSSSGSELTFQSVHTNEIFASNCSVVHMNEEEKWVTVFNERSSKSSRSRISKRKTTTTKNASSDHFNTYLKKLDQQEKINFLKNNIGKTGKALSKFYNHYYDGKILSVTENAQNDPICSIKMSWTDKFNRPDQKYSKPYQTSLDKIVLDIQPRFENLKLGQEVIFKRGFYQSGGYACETWVEGVIERLSLADELVSGKGLYDIFEKVTVDRIRVI